MKPSKIKPIVFSAIAFLLMIVTLACVFSLVFFHIQHKDTLGTSQSRPSPADPTPSSPVPTSSETPTEPLSSPSATSSETLPVSGEPSPSIPEGDFVLKKTEDAGLDYQNRIVFLGDSTTYGMLPNMVLPDKADSKQVLHGAGGTLSLPNVTTNLIYAGSSTEGKLLGEYLSEVKPEILVITLGVGVSDSLNESRFSSYYKLVIDTVLSSSPNTKIICNSIYPVCQARDESYQHLNNPDIEKANAWIGKVAQGYYESGKKVYYLDSYSLLLGSDGYMPSPYSNGDGLHLSKAAFEIVLGNIRTHKVPD